MIVPVVVGDTVVVHERHRQTFRRAFGEQSMAKRKVTHIDSVQGRERLCLDGSPHALWRSQATKVPTSGAKE